MLLISWGSSRAYYRLGCRAKVDSSAAGHTVTPPSAVLTNLEDVSRSFKKRQRDKVESTNHCTKYERQLWFSYAICWFAFSNILVVSPRVLLSVQKTQKTVWTFELEPNHFLKIDKPLSYCLESHGLFFTSFREQSGLVRRVGGWGWYSLGQEAYVFKCKRWWWGRNRQGCLHVLFENNCTGRILIHLISFGLL